MPFYDPPNDSSAVAVTGLALVICYALLIVGILGAIAVGLVLLNA